jgi:hypothetical protein
MSKDDTCNSSLSRRAIIKIGGMALVGVWSQRTPAIAGPQAASGPQTGKPIFLAPSDATDAAVHSRAENLFWCEMMAEHAAFFAMLMPGQSLATVRAQAETFQRNFQAQYDRAKTATFDRTNYAAFNRSTIEMLKPLIEFKQRMRDAQEAGRIRTLVFPLFFDHTAREGERAMARIEKLAGGNAALDFTEVVGFWSVAMSDHAELIAHLLDPQEQELVSQALDSSALFKGFHHGNLDRKLPGGEIMLATEELIDFQTAIENGINTGRVKSILDPALADHMRRETLKFVDELKRTVAKT